MPAAFKMDLWTNLLIKFFSKGTVSRDFYSNAYKHFIRKSYVHSFQNGYQNYLV